MAAATAGSASRYSVCSPPLACTTGTCAGAPAWARSASASLAPAPARTGPVPARRGTAPAPHTRATAGWAGAPVERSGRVEYSASAWPTWPTMRCSQCWHWAMRWLPYSSSRSRQVTPVCFQLLTTGGRRRAHTFSDSDTCLLSLGWSFICSRMYQHPCRAMRLVTAARPTQGTRAQRAAACFRWQPAPDDNSIA